MAAFYFFTEPDKLEAQTEGQAFGPVTSSQAGSYVAGRDRFRITSFHNSTDTSVKAFAICSGTIQIQETNQAGIVNMILKPNHQPESDTPFISYFIYKGIKTDSLWDAGGDILNGSSQNDLVKKINASSGANNDEQPTKNALGAHQTSSFQINNQTLFTDTDPVDNLFYKGDPDFTPHFIYGGEWIGDFDPNQFGLEIIVERIGYRPAISLARKLGNYIDIDSYSGPSVPSNNAGYFEHWHKKEEMLNFLDPCFFWGSFGEKQLKAWDSTAQKHKALTYTDVYAKVIKGTSGNFLNRNTICLDIRSEHGGSFNYYKNYGDFFQSTTDDWATITDQNYYISDWPWLLLTAPSGLTAGQESVVLDISLPKTDNTLPLVYLSQLPGTAPISDPERFVEVRRQSFSDHVTPVSVVLPLVDEGGVLKYRVAIARLMYLRRIDKNDYVNPPVPAATTLPYKEHLDNIFQPYRMGIPFDRKGKLAIKVYGQEVFVDKTHVDGTRFVGYAGLCEDQDNYTFFVFPVRGGSRNDVQSIRGYTKNTTIDMGNTAQSFLDYLMKQYGYFFIKHENTVNGQTVNTYSVLNNDGMLEKPSVLIANKLKITAAKTSATTLMNDIYPIRLSILRDTGTVITPTDNVEAFEEYLLGFNGTSLVKTVYFLILEKSFSYGNI